MTRRSVGKRRESEGKALAEDLSRYWQENPGRKINIIALSAGTGVAVWACENVADGVRINHLIFLGSSLSANYDMHRALKCLDGQVYVYHSTKDVVLQGAVRILGTIDGAVGESAGLTGLKHQDDRIVNIAWSPEYRRLGWRGGHTEAADSETFIEKVIGRRHIVSPPLLARY